MSFREVNALRKSGRLEEAYDLARADLQQEKSEWTYSAMFWVLSDYGKRFVNQGQKKKAQECLDRMEILFDNINDFEGYAERAINSLRRQLTPNWDVVYNMSELAKAGNVEEAYIKLTELHKLSPLDPKLHEDFGWVIFRYLNKKYEEIGSVNARKALLTYMELENERPSLLHSQILNVATKVSENYEDFKFLPFLKMWNSQNFSEEDYQSSYWEGRELSPLVDRIIERCFKLGYSLDEVEQAFEGNPRTNIAGNFSRNCFFEISRLYNGDLTAFLSKVDDYLNSIDSRDVKNEFHSKILSMYIRKLPEDRSAEFIPSFEKWGFQNFNSEDWKREKYEDKDMPSLVEKAIGRYLKALKLRQYRDANESFVDLLNESISRFPDDDQLERNLALIKIAQGERSEALSIYRRLLLRLNRYYVWKELSDATDDRTLKISALCKAILSELQDKFLGNVHLSLASLLIEDNLLDVAKGELNSFRNTYKSEGWGPNDEYRRLVKLIPEAVVGAENNKAFYLNHVLPAEEFVYSDIEWTTMVVSDVYLQKKGDRDVEQAKLVSAEGIELTTKLKNLKEKRNKAIGKCYDVKIIKHDNRNDIGLIRKSGNSVSDILSPEVVCYVDYYNKERKCYHLVSQNNKQMILTQKVQLSEGQFCSCYEVPQIDTKSNRPLHAIFSKTEDTQSSIELFPIKIAVVDHINESKQLFHCVFGRGMDIVIKYSETKLRPQIGDYVQIRYIWKRNKENRIIRKMLNINPAESHDSQLTKVVEGPIRLNINSKGKSFGFVEDYYVPTHLLGDVEEDDNVEVSVVLNGEKWEAYKLQKIE